MLLNYFVDVCVYDLITKNKLELKVELSIWMRF